MAETEWGGLSEQGFGLFLCHQVRDAATSVPDGRNQDALILPAQIAKMHQVHFVRPIFVRKNQTRSASNTYMPVSR